MTRRLYRPVTMRALGTLLAGALIIAFPENATRYLVMSIGLLFLVPGMLSILTYFTDRNRNKGKSSAQDNGGVRDDRADKGQPLYFPTIGLGSCLFGLMLLLFPSAFKDILVYLLGAFAVVAAVVQGANIHKLGKVYRTSSLMYVVPVLVGIAGITVIALNHYALTADEATVQSLGTVSVPPLIAGFAFVAYGLSETAYALYFRKPAMRDAQPASETVLTLTLTRHGQTVENDRRILQGQSPGHLNETGIAQAQALRDTLRASDYDIMVCSDLERTRRTAQIINDKLQLPIEYTPLLRERDWGEYTGMHISEITLPPSQFPPSVENSEQLAERAHRFIAFLLEHYAGKRVLAVGHGYFNRCVQATIEHKTVRQTPRWGNAETRTFMISRETASHTAPTDFLVSED